MVIIQLAGGLGNQMFQYALYLQLKSQGRTVKIDDVSGFVEDRQREPALGAFGITYERASRPELEAMLDSSPQLRHKIRRKLCGRKKKAYFEEDKRYKPAVLTWDDIYLEGYWQTEKYFQTVTGQVKDTLDPDRLLAAEAKACGIGGSRSTSAPASYKAAHDAGGRTLAQWLAQTSATESVSVHIRRGDYLLPENQALFGGICTEDYYRAAMARMQKMHPGCVFYLFTNDKQWAGEWADRGQIEPVALTDVPDSGMGRDYAEFLLMSRCRHNILANSSFSWWASYLNKNPHKTVLAPDRWLNGWDCEDFYRADMQKVTVG